MPELSSSGGGPLRPGSMTVAMNAARPRTSGPRWLRWALVRDGRIVEEAHLPPDRALTVGHDGVLTAPGATRELLTYRDGAWRLRILDGLIGRTDGGPIDEVVSESGERREIELRERGRLELPGGIVVLVQVVDRPPAKLRPQLPVSLRGGFLRGADWWFTAFVAGSFFVHFALIVFLSQADWPVEQALIPERFAEAIFVDPPLPDEPDIPEVESGEPGDEFADNSVGEDANDERETEQPRTTERVRPSTPSHDPTLSGEDIERMMAHHAVLTGLGDGLNTAIEDVLAGGMPPGQAAEIYGIVQGSDIATNEPGPMAIRNGAHSEVEGPRGLAGFAGDRGGRGTHEVAEGPPIQEIPVTVTAPHPSEVEEHGSAAFDSSQLIATLRRRMSAVRRCYENEISHGDPNLAGRLTIVMDVMPVGSLANVHVEDNSTGSSALAACVVRRIRRIRMTSGPESSVEVHYPIVFARQD